jgi:hypothetical protein
MPSPNFVEASKMRFRVNFLKGFVTAICYDRTLQIPILFYNVRCKKLHTGIIFVRIPTTDKTLEVKAKGKTVPLQAWNGPEGSRKFRFPDFMTTAQDCGKIVRITHRPPLPPEIHLVIIFVRGCVDPGQ